MSFPYESLFDPTVPIESIIVSSKAFFEANGLSRLAVAITTHSAPATPVDLPFRFAFPAPGVQRAHGGDLVAALASAELDGIDNAEQYATPYAPSVEELPSIEDKGRPESPYLLAFDPEVFADELRGLTAPAIRKQLAAAEQTSLTALEYVVLQRIMTEYYGDHRFDYYGTDVENTRWMWLPDSKLGDKTFMGYWNPGKNRVELSLCRAGSKNPRKGAYKTRIYPFA